MGLSSLAITEDRSAVVDFFVPIWMETSSFLIKYSDENSLLYYTRPFQVQLLEK